MFAVNQTVTSNGKKRNMFKSTANLHTTMSSKHFHCCSKDVIVVVGIFSGRLLTSGECSQIGNTFVERLRLLVRCD